MLKTRLFFATVLVSSAAYADLTPEQTQFFESKVRPVLSQNCYKCHSLEAGKSKGGLTLDTKDATLKGGENGPAVKPGDIKESLMLTAISYNDPDLKMPPKGEKLTPQQVADLTEWVKMGAPDPRTATVVRKLTGLTDEARSHWAYQQVKKPAVPAVKNSGWPTTPVDNFILAKLEAKGMTPAPDLKDGPGESGRETLLRRASYDLIGLPPTPAEMNAFLADADPLPVAFSKVVDRLLASPHYGERWGRFWLDSARYADTTGERNAQNEDYRLPYAYTYRDWVINAFNSDMPYDKFIVQQLAADKLSSNAPENLAALGFLTVGQRFGNQNDVINDRIDVVSKAFLAMTVACARCHDHKFDPIPTKDYYSLHGVFSSISEPKEEPIIKNVDPKKKAEFDQKLSVYEQENRDKYYETLADYTAEFRSKAASYVLVAHFSRNDSSEENQQKAEKISTEQKLDRTVVNEVRGRLTNRNNEIFGPFACFLEGGDSWKAIAAQVSKDSKYNPVVTAAFKDAQPKTFEDIAAIYGKIFASIDAKAPEIYKAYAAAKPALGASANTASASDPKGNGMMMAEMKPESMMMGMMGGNGKGDGSAVAGVDPSIVNLVSAPLQIIPAYKLDTDSLRSAINGWPLQLRGKGGFAFNKVNELLLTDPGVPERAMVVVDKPHPQNSPVFIRGQAETRGAVEPRHFLEALCNGAPQPFKDGSGRLELAQAIASKTNPLTARVLVNRVWMHHMGQAFVRTPDDLGTQSEPPSHPELLDYLASYLMDQNWDVKKLHKLIMLSRVYQESSDTRRQYETVDPENRLLWRANIRRLDFEATRDSLLVMAGTLDPKMGGQPVNLTEEPYSCRRSVYGYVDRGNLPELLSNFDFSNPDMPNSTRTSTVVPQQALFLMNSPMAVDVARKIIARPEFRNAGNGPRRLNAIFQIVFQRSIGSAAETDMAVKFLGTEVEKQPSVITAMKDIDVKAEAQAKKRAEDRANSDSGTKAIQNEGSIVERAPLNPWETFAQALLMSNEAVYVN